MLVLMLTMLSKAEPQGLKSQKRGETAETVRTKKRQKLAPRATAGYARQLKIINDFHKNSPITRMLSCHHGPLLSSNKGTKLI